MAIYLNDVSRTFGEYLLIPGLTTKECIPACLLYTSDAADE